MRFSNKSYDIPLVEHTNTPSNHGEQPLLETSSHLSPTPRLIVRHNRRQQQDEEFIETSCGIGTWRPEWLQVFATPMFFMFNMALVGIIQGMTGTLFFSSISTFEKRYAFDSKISGVILIADNFAEMILNPIVGYIGVRYNRARLIAIGEVILSISCFLTASPYFFYGSATHLSSQDTLIAHLTLNRSHFEMCSADNDPMHDCSSGTGATVWPAIVLLIMGSFARGLGYTCYFVIGFPYLDDNVSKKKSPIYISAMQAIRLIGPASGFMLSSFCLRMYENPFVDPGFGRNDPRFVGAWWLSFCITGTLILIVALPMFLFPPQFKNASVNAAEMNKKIKENGGSVGAMKRFITNPVVMLCLLGNIFRYIGMGGFLMFKSKYIEAQFRQSSSSASFITGTANFFPMAIGILLGGLVISFLRPKPRLIFLMVFLVESVSLFTIGSGLFLGCPPVNINGNVDESGRFSLIDSNCNQECQCSTRVFTPICEPTGQTTYFSPCFAGCTSYSVHAQNRETFEHCCFKGVATSGYCKSDATKCTTLFKYITIISIGSIVSATARTANSLIALRNVDPMDKGFAIGVASTLMDIFAFIPYPLLFGYIADKACLIWESKCGKTGNCWLYDHDKFRNYLHGGAIFFMAIGSIFDFATIFYSGRVKNFYEDEEEEIPAASTDNAGSVRTGLTIVNEAYGRTSTNALPIDFVHGS